MKQVITDYLALKTNMAFLIDASGYKIDYIAQKTGILKPHFYSKKKRNKWTEDEMMKIIDVIDNEELEDIFLAKRIDETKNDEPASLEELRKILRS
jgi:hypothetical protein